MKENQEDNVIWEHSPFMELFSSAVLFLQMSLEENENENLFARESLINCVFALEASANCLLDTLNLSKKFHDDLDKLTTINKFEFYLNTKFINAKIDRGNTIIQKVEELINIRNRFVHPKLVRINGDYIEGVVDGNNKIYKARRINKKTATNISTLSTDWMSFDAKSAVQIIVDFYVYYFIDICKYKLNHVSGILCTKNRFFDNTADWIISNELITAFKVLNDLNMLKRSFMEIPNEECDIIFITEDEV